MEQADMGNVVAIFQIMTNELSTPKVLLCPKDRNHVEGTKFDIGFTAQNISYFIGLDAGTNRPRTLLAGDANLIINDKPVKSGLLEFSTNTVNAWSPGRHVSANSHFWTAARYRYVGNILFADESVQQFDTADLRQVLQQTGLVTNRLAIP